MEPDKPIDEAGKKLLFTEDEWNAAIPIVTEKMTAYLKQYRTAVYEDKGDHGCGHGSGSYLNLDSKIYILTNQHVSEPRSKGMKQIHLFNDTEDLRRVLGDQHEKHWPFDLALLLVDQSAWSTVSHTSKAIGLDQISLAHVPVEGELMAFTGFPGVKTEFYFNTLCSEAQCYVVRECSLPEDDRFDMRFHFGMDYLPERATTVIGKSGLSLPPGLSGSTVWNTGFVHAKMINVDWTPQMARVTGVLWGWPEDKPEFVVATRAEYLRSFLLACAFADI